jgi:hypothetical protein
VRFWGRVGAGPAAATRLARALRLLVGARRALRAGAATDDVLRALTSTASGRPCAPDVAAAAVRRAARLLPATTCLPRAVALAALITPRDDEVVVVLGAKRDAAAQWVAHAWVEVDRRPWLDDGAATFQRLAAYAARADWSLAREAGSG